MKTECGGWTITLSLDEQMRAWIRCGTCGKVVKLRKNASGFAAVEAYVAKHRPNGVK